MYTGRVIHVSTGPITTPRHTVPVYSTVVAHDDGKLPAFIYAGENFFTMYTVPGCG